MCYKHHGPHVPCGVGAWEHAHVFSLVGILSTAFVLFMVFLYIQGCPSALDINESIIVTVKHLLCTVGETKAWVMACPGSHRKPVMHPRGGFLASALD